MACRTWVTSDGDLLSVRASRLPDKAIMFAFCDEIGASAYLCLTREEAFELAKELVKQADWAESRSEYERDD
jgi:hypothetical protein